MGRREFERLQVDVESPYKQRGIGGEHRDNNRDGPDERSTLEECLRSPISGYFSSLQAS